MWEESCMPLLGLVHKDSQELSMSSAATWWMDIEDNGGWGGELLTRQNTEDIKM